MIVTRYTNQVGERVAIDRARTAKPHDAARERINVWKGD
jgi:hypothetical protein